MLLVLTLVSLASAADLAPLSGSEYAAQNPGVLPYEKCQIRAWKADIWTEGLGGSLVYGGHHYYDEALTRLNCWSDTLGIAFEIPVTLSRLRHAGINADLSTVKWNKRMSVKGLAGKKVQNLFSKYKGIEVGLGIGVGGVAATFVNTKLIQINDAHGDLKLGLNLGGTGFVVSPREAIDPAECQDPYLLTGSEQPLDGADCVANGGAQVDFSKLMSLRFEKIKKNDR